MAINFASDGELICITCEQPQVGPSHSTLNLWLAKVKGAQLTARKVCEQFVLLVHCQSHPRRHQLRYDKINISN